MENKPKPTTGVRPKLTFWQFLLRWFLITLAGIGLSIKRATLLSIMVWVLLGGLVSILITGLKGLGSFGLVLVKVLPEAGRRLKLGLAGGPEKRYALFLGYHALYDGYCPLVVIAPVVF